jgi:hypothetical protein
MHTLHSRIMHIIGLNPPHIPPCRPHTQPRHSCWYGDLRPPLFFYFHKSAHMVIFAIRCVTVSSRNAPTAAVTVQFLTATFDNWLQVFWYCSELRLYPLMSSFFPSNGCSGVYVTRHWRLSTLTCTQTCNLGLSESGGWTDHCIITSQNYINWWSGSGLAYRPLHTSPKRRWTLPDLSDMSLSGCWITGTTSSKRHLRLASV